MKKLLCLVLLWGLGYQNSFSQQLPYNLRDGLQDSRCTACRELIRSKPPEVLFGIHINPNGDVFFSMNNKEWFNKLFKDDYAVSADIVSADRYDCNTVTKSGELIRGYLFQPVYKKDFKGKLTDTPDGGVSLKIGTLPDNLLKKDVEGNVVIIYGQHICFYSTLLNIDRTVWELLPMGLFSDSLINATTTGIGNKTELFTYEKKMQVVVPFAKNQTKYEQAVIKPLYDSLQMATYWVKKIEIRAYASVEGPEKINLQLMKGRADAMITALKKFQPSMERVSIITAENWTEFLDDIKKTEYNTLATLSKEDVKQKLADKTVNSGLEKILSAHRKAIVTVYLERKTQATTIPDSSILTEFKKAIDHHDSRRAAIIQKEIANRIMDNRLPNDYLDRLEVPASKEYWSILNDKEIYKYLLKETTEYEALENFKALSKLDPSNGRINYNICSLQFFIWLHSNVSPDKDSFLQAINNLEGQGIKSSLVKRMLVNYHILMAGEYMRTFNYTKKDESLLFIKNTYAQLRLNDDEIFSIVKYFSFYAHRDWAEQLIIPRIDKIDVSENLVFYYVNLSFFFPDRYGTEQFKKAVLNAINLNRQRFCNFFLATHKGGASLQLREHDILKKFYCENCSGKGAVEPDGVASTK